jgi:hypothetical protein
MFLPTAVPGQMVDEIQGIPSSQVVLTMLSQSTAGTAAYTVPAGYTLLLHGYAIQGNASGLGGTATYKFDATVLGVIGGSGSNTGFGVDRHRLLPANSGTGLTTALGAVGTTAPAAQAALLSSVFLNPENAPYLFWPLPAGATISIVVTGSLSSATWSLLGTLIPA